MSIRFLPPPNLGPVSRKGKGQLRDSAGTTAKIVCSGPLFLSRSLHLTVDGQASLCPFPSEGGVDMSTPVLGQHLYAPSPSRSRDR